MLAVADGISLLMVLSALLRRRLMVSSTWYMEMAARKICIALATSKECARQSIRALCAWDSGSVNVLVMALLTHTLVGTQFPEFMWKKYHPHRLKPRY